MRGGKCVGSAGLAISHIQMSPSSAPEARWFGERELNSKPRTWKKEGAEYNHKMLITKSQA